ncbi:hypothetical protein DIPPA_15068 [Diplonema papillatum]|nr:hypothetical protein DIPPA_15068 [Diplonema papillatum]
MQLLSGLFFLAAVPVAVAQCSACLQNCGLSFHGNGGLNMSQYLPYHSGFAFKMWEDCDTLRELNVEYPDLWLRPVANSEYSVTSKYDGSFSIYSDLLETKDELLGILNVDVQWVLASGSRLAPYPEWLANSMRPKWRLINMKGETLGAPHRADQIVMYYRKDLFKKHDIDLDFTSWETFEADVNLMQSKEAAARGNSSYRAFSYNIIGSASDMCVMLSTLLSGYDAGTVVDPDGTVSINSERAVKTLAMMRRWADTILHPLTLLEGNDAMSLLENDETAVILNWTSVSDHFLSVNQRTEFNIAIGPVPGPTGAGCSGSWNMALAAHAPMRNLSFRIMATLLDTDSEINVTDQEPVTEKFFEDPDLWNRWCVNNYILCAAAEEYPEFFSRLTHRPSEGCGALFENCQNTIQASMIRFLEGTVSPAQTVAELEVSLKVLLGIVKQDAPYEEPSSWTDMKISGVVVGTISIVFIIVLLVIFFLKVMDLRRPKGCSIPLSMFLTGMACVLFLVIQVITLTTWYDTLNEISSDLGSDARKSSLHMLTETTQQSIEDSFDQWSGAALSIMKATVESGFVRKLPGLDLDPRSLVLMIDQVEGRIAVSSDANKQPDGVYISEGLTAWGLAGLGVLGSIGGSLNATSFRADVDGKPCFLDADTVYFVETSSKVDGYYRQIGYLIVYIVPEEVVFTDADKALEKSVWTSVLFLCIGLACLTTASAIITLPLVALALDIEEVRVMRLEKLLNSTKSSMLTEIASLLLGFQHMCKVINEYKAFMPQTLFMGSENEDEISEDSSPKSQGSLASRSSLGSQHSPDKLLTAIAKNDKMMAVQLSGLQNVRGAVLSITVHPAGGNPGDDTAPVFNIDNFKTVFSAVEQLVHSSSGVIHSFPTLHAEEIIASWGMNGSCSSAPQRAVTAAFDLKSLVNNTKVRLSLAVCAGRFKAGNIGSSQTRGFCVAGNPVKSYDAVVKSASALSSCLQRTIIVCDKEGADMPGFVMFEVDVANIDGKRTFFKEVISRAGGDMQEWMYELDDLKKNATVLSQFLTSGETIDLPSLAKAMEHSACTSEDRIMFENLKLLITAFPDAVPNCTTLAYDCVFSMNLVPKKEEKLPSH